VHGLGGEKTAESKVRAAEEAGPPVKGSLACIDWKSKEKREEIFQKGNTRPHKAKIYLHKYKTL
jgi:hypothetical protein